MSVRLEEENNKITLPLMGNGDLSDEERLGMASDTHTSTRSFSSVEEYELMTKREKIINQRVESYKNSALIDNSHTDMSTSDQMAAEIRAKNLDNWYNSGEYGLEIEPILKIARDKNKLPSELMAEDTQYLNLVNSLAVQEAIPEFKDSSEKQQSFSSFSRFNNEAQQAKSTLDLVNKNSLDPKAFDIAKAHNLPPSMVLSDSPETKKLLERFSAPQLDTSLDTPAIFRFMQNGDFAIKMAPNIDSLQRMENNFRQGGYAIGNALNDIYFQENATQNNSELSTKKKDDGLYRSAGLVYQNEQDRENTIHSTKILDTAKYHTLKTYVGLVSATNWLLKDSFLDVDLMGAPLSSYANRTIVDMSKVVETMPHNMKGSKELKGAFKEDAWGGVNFIYDNPGVVADLILDDVVSDKLSSVLVAKAPLPQKIKDGLSSGISSVLSNTTSDIVHFSDQEEDPQKVMGYAYKRLEKRALLGVAQEFVPKIKSNIKPVDHFVNTITSDLFKEVAEKWIIDGEVITKDQLKDTFYNSLIGAVLDAPLPNDKVGNRLNHQGNKLFQQYPNEMSSVLSSIAQSFNVNTDNVYLSHDAFIKVADKKGVAPETLYRKLNNNGEDLALALGHDVKIDLPALLALNQQVDYPIMKNIKISANSMSSTQLDAFTEKADKTISELKAKQETLFFNYHQAYEKYNKRGVNNPEKHAVVDAVLENSLAQLTREDLAFNDLTVLIDNKMPAKEGFINIDEVSKHITINFNNPVNYNSYVKSARKLYIYQLLETAKKPNNTVSIKELSRLKQFLGSSDLSQLTDQQEQRLDNLLAGYLKADNQVVEELNGVSGHFIQWSENLYKGMSSAGIRFDKDLTQSLDGLKSLQRKQTSNIQLFDQFSDVKDIGISQEVFIGYKQMEKVSTNTKSQEVKVLIKQNNLKELAFEEEVLIKKILTSSKVTDSSSYQPALTILNDNELEQIVQSYLQHNLIKDLDIDSYLNAMRAENKKAKAAFKENRLRDALDAKRKERLNYIFYLKILDEQKKDEKTQGIIKKLTHR